MLRRCVREIVLWGGLTALGVGIGVFAAPLPHARGQTPNNHYCRDIDCFDVLTYGGFFCGWCTGGAIMPRFDKCMPTPGANCTENAQLYGTYTCNGTCADELTFCPHSYAECQ